MNLAVKVALLSSGLFLFVGMIAGILKYRGMMASDNHKAPMYIDIAHRAALMYSFAALVMAELLKYSPYTLEFQLVICVVPLFFFALAIAQYLKLGIEGREVTQYSERNFNTTWGTILLVVGELGGVGFIVWGFVYSQMIA